MPCSFWLTDNNVLQGRYDEARDPFGRLGLPSCHQPIVFDRSFTIKSSVLSGGVLKTYWSMQESFTAPSAATPDPIKRLH